MILIYERKDKPNAPPSMCGPYSAAEAARALTYLLELDNIKAVRVMPRPDWF